MPLLGQATGTGFLGVNLRKDRVSLADQDLAKAINADLHTQVGAIVLRLGRTKQNTTALTDLVIRRLARINSNRYRVAGQSVYCDTTRIINGLLSTNLITTLTPFRPLSDTKIWAFIADDAVMRKANCATVQKWGIAVPTTITGRIGYKGALTGAYSLRVTSCRFAGTAVAHESNPATATSTLTLASQSICVGDLENTADSQVSGFGIYRTTAGGSTHLLDEKEAFSTSSTVSTTYTVTHDWEASASHNELLHQFTQPDSVHTVGGDALRAMFDWEKNSGFTGTHEDSGGYKGTHLWEIGSQGDVTTQTKRWAYSSNLADASLGALVETDNTVPPLASWCESFQEHVFLCRDAANPHYLWWSKRFRPESVPAANFIEVGNPDDPLQCAIATAGLFGVFSRKTKYRILGNVTSGFVHQEGLSKRGTPAPLAAVGSEFGVIFVAHDGVFNTNFLAVDDELSHDIWPLFNDETVNDMSPINWDAVNTMAAETFKGRYYLAYPSGTATQPDKIAVFSQDTRKWYFYDHPLRSLLYEEDTDIFLGGGTDGFIYVLESGSDDAGTNISLTVETKDYFGESKDVLKLFQWLRVDGDTQGQSVTVKFYVDDTLKHTTTFSTSGRTERLLPLPEGVLGYHWRVQFTYTGATRIRLYPAASLYAPLQAA